MNIKILDSWLKEYLETNATAQQIAKALSLTSVSVERVESYKNDFVYDIEITTNRPDLASVNGLAREAGAVLPQNGIEAKYKPLTTKPNVITNEVMSSRPNKVSGGISTRQATVLKRSLDFARDDKETSRNDVLSIQVDTKFVNRVCAAVLDVRIGKSPELIKDRLESSGIRSINNLIDITNYVMRVTGQPTHVFDYDRLGGGKLVIREAKKDEEITTLDNKMYQLSGGEIVAENDKGEIVDLLGIMGLANSVVTKKTKRIVFFVNNIDSNKVRKASMLQGIRTEAAQLNEKHLDPALCETAMHYGIQLYEKLAQGKIVSKIIDIYPNKLEEKQVRVSLQKINSVIGVEVPKQRSIDILSKLGFSVESKENSLNVTVPTLRAYDINLPEDIIEEIARVYGYHNLPGKLPLLNTVRTQRMEKNQYYWEQKSKNALKYWGFTEVYTYSLVSENLYEGPLDEAVTIANPLNEEFVYMRKTLVPSLLRVLSENKNFETIKLFEIANVYNKRDNELPNEIRMLAGIIKQAQISFFVVKGYIEQLFKDLGITDYAFRPTNNGGDGASIFLLPSPFRRGQGEVGVKGEKHVGNIEILDTDLINFEINFDLLCKFASLKKTYTKPYKFPPIFEDIALRIPEKILTGEVIIEIKQQNPLIKDVSLLDRYNDSRTFHIIYQDENKNLTTEEVKEIHKDILQTLNKKWGVKEKE